MAQPDEEGGQEDILHHPADRQVRGGQGGGQGQRDEGRGEADVLAPGMKGRTDHEGRGKARQRVDRGVTRTGIAELDHRHTAGTGGQGPEQDQRLLPVESHRQQQTDAHIGQELETDRPQRRIGAMGGRKAFEGTGQGGHRVGLGQQLHREEPGLQVRPVLPRRQAGEEHGRDHDEDHRSDQARIDAEETRGGIAGHAGRFHGRCGDHVARQDEEAVQGAIDQEVRRDLPRADIGQSLRDEEGMGVQDHQRKDDAHRGEIVGLVFQPSQAVTEQEMGLAHRVNSLFHPR